MLILKQRVKPEIALADFNTVVFIFILIVKLTRNGFERLFQKRCLKSSL